MRKAKIVATIGPATANLERLRTLFKAGADVARLNFSHGNHDFYGTLIRSIRQVSEDLCHPIAILQDLQGVKIRTGKLVDGGPVTLETGASFSITSEPLTGDSRMVSCSYPDLYREVGPGHRILLSDGRIELVVEQVDGSVIQCRVEDGGELAENQGINIPGAQISAPSLTEKDIADLRFGVENGVDYIALSFVRKAEDVLELKRLLAEWDADIPVIAKLEKPSAIDSLPSILASCEGVMVARGDLGVELSPERVPVIQKEVIRMANREGKLVITATQMLESMIFNPQPTRAEASDVANAVIDGTDAVMLSAETATGNYPVETVKMMARIISEAEKLEASTPYRVASRDAGLSFPQAVCRSAYEASISIKAHAIVAFTQTGSTARMISKYRPGAEILGFTPYLRVMNRMSLYWGVRPLIMPMINNVDELIKALERLLLNHNLAQVGDNLIILTGAPILEQGHTSLMKLHTVEAPPLPREETDASAEVLGERIPGEPHTV